MAKRVHCGKKTKVYIPKTVNPQIISYRPHSTMQNINDLNEKNITKQD